MSLFLCSIIQAAVGMACLKIWLLFAEKTLVCHTTMVKIYGVVKMAYQHTAAKPCRAIKRNIFITGLLQDIYSIQLIVWELKLRYCIATEPLLLCIKTNSVLASVSKQA